MMDLPLNKQMRENTLDSHCCAVYERVGSYWIRSKANLVDKEVLCSLEWVYLEILATVIGRNSLKEGGLDVNMGMSFQVQQLGPQSIAHSAGGSL
jgi:hypothetical protein